MKSIKSALDRSLKTEEQALQSRFEKADALFEPKPQLRHSAAERVIRDSFTLPNADYELITTLRARCLRSACNATKSEIMRAGLHALNQMSDEQLLVIVQGLAKVKTGRPSTTV